MSIPAVTMARDFPEPCNRPSEEGGQGWDRTLSGLGIAEKNSGNVITESASCPPSIYSLS